MTQARLIEKVAQEARIKKASAKRAVKSVVDSIVDSLRNEGKISVAGLGVFKAKDTKARTGRNPKTGESVQIPAGKRVSFKAGVKLKKAVKQ